MTRRQVRGVLLAIFGIALVLRVLALAFEPPHHPDEFFQYLEPAWRHLTGAGVQTWEWRTGVRSWVLPGYHGAWMALLMRLGVRDGITLATILRTHWALLSLTLVGAGWRGGALLARRLARLPPPPIEDASSLAAAPLSGWQGGLCGALLCAAFPPLVRFSVHTLSELASMLCLVWALVLAGELGESATARPRARAAWLGVLLGLGICLRIQHAPVAVVVGLWLLVARRFRQLPIVVATALLPVALFGAVDWLTWGKPLISFIAYVKFNLLESGANLFGKQPAVWYAQVFFHRLPAGLFVVGLFALLGLRASWPFVTSALGLVVLLSTQAHKEERFAMLFWPLVLIPAAGLAGAWLAARRAAPPSAPDAPAAPAPASPRRRWLARAAAALLVILVLTDGAIHCRGNDFEGLTPRRFELQAWVGRQPDVTGLIYDEPLYVGGYLWFGRSLPQLMWNPALLDNPLFSHVLVGRGSGEMLAALRKGFVEVHRAGDFVVLRRQAELPQNRP